METTEKKKPKQKSLYKKHKVMLDEAKLATELRAFHASYPEHPKPYGEDAPAKGMEAYQAMLNKPFEELKQEGASSFEGEEESPFTQSPLGITYPIFDSETLIIRAESALAVWRKVSVNDRAGILIESLEKVKDRFFDIAQATMHTTGQAFMMSFQASGPHSNDRAMEAISMGHKEQIRFPSDVLWDKPMGKFNIVLDKTYQPIPRGLSLVIGCSTFPVWNTVPGLYASLVCGNPVIVKPHPKAVLPIAIVVAEIRKVLEAEGLDPNIVQLGADTSSKLIAKELAEDPRVKLVDFTGNSEFGTSLENLPNKVVFTEKTGVNSVILDSVTDLDAVFQNLAFSVSLYSGQMCTAPQNIYIPEAGIKAGDEQVSYEDVLAKLKENISGLAGHPKMGAGTLAAVQNEATLARAKDAAKLGGNLILEAKSVDNEEFTNARTSSPAIVEVDSSMRNVYENELFGPIVVVVKTKDTAESVQIAKGLALEQGAITCAAYTTDAKTEAMIIEQMNEAYTPVSINLTGYIWVNQHAAFSDFHVTGGNPSGNATFTDPLYVNRRFVWVGNRKLSES